MSFWVMQRTCPGSITVTLCVSYRQVCSCRTQMMGPDSWQPMNLTRALMESNCSQWGAVAATARPCPPLAADVISPRFPLQSILTFLPLYTLRMCGSFTLNNIIFVIDTIPFDFPSDLKYSHQPDLLAWTFNLWKVETLAVRMFLRANSTI